MIRFVVCTHGPDLSRCHCDLALANTRGVTRRCQPHTASDASLPRGTSPTRGSVTMTAVRLHPQLPKVAAAAFAVVVVVFFVLRSQASTPAESAGAALKPRVVKPVVLPPKAQPVDAAPPANPGSQLAHAEAVEGGEAEPRCAHAVCEEANCAFGEVSVAMPLVPGEGGNGDDKEELPCCPKTECEPRACWW